MRQHLLGVAIDKLNVEDALKLIDDWVEGKQVHYVVTPNVEMIMSAQNDDGFKSVLNKSDLAIPDSARIGWGLNIQKEKNLFFRVLLWPFFVIPTMMPGNRFPVVTGVDLMEKLIHLSNEKGYRIGFLGGKNNVAIKLSERLANTHPGLKIEFIQENLQVGDDGSHIFFDFENLIGFRENKSISDAREKDFYDNLNSRKLDLLFVAFGHPKQEKWMSKNLHLLNVRVMLGVGGAFDYLSGSVQRAPQWMRRLGFEWLYRLIQQPWRLSRFGSLIKFVFRVFISKPV